MFITHTSSIYSEDIILLDYIPRAQYGHQITDGGKAVQFGIKTLPAVLVDLLLSKTKGLDNGAINIVQELTQNPAIKIGFILAAGGNSWTGALSSLARSDRYPVNKVPTLGGTQVYAGHIANKMGAFDSITTDCSSCISGHAAWHTARNMILLGQMDSMVVITVDNGLSEDYLDIFGEHGLSMSASEEGTGLTKFRLGQGANITVFESSKTVRLSAHTPRAEVYAICLAAETHSSPLGISGSGAGYTKVIEASGAHKYAFVKTHSTFSADNEVESKIVQSKFPGIREVNYKLRIGHTMGASTAVETCLAIDEEYGIFLSLGAGMGNAFSAAVLEILK
jgi:hypothetical protein